MDDEEREHASEGPLKPLRTILSGEIGQAEEELARPRHGIFMSGVLAGSAVGTGTLAVATVLTLATGELPPAVVSLLAANAYTIGFIVVILAHTDLFTEYTTIAILPVLLGRAGVSSLARLWGLVYAGNLVGAAAFALLLAHLGPGLDVVDASTLERMGARLIDHAWWVVLLSGILAGWLMGLLSWLIAAGRDTISQIVFVWLVTGVLKLGELHHSVTGALDVMAAFFAGGDLPVAAAIGVLVVTVLGNAIGGVIFAVLIRYSLVVRGGKAQESEREDEGANEGDGRPRTRRARPRE
jgi:formate-nitrite transporter family protein